MNKFLAVLIATAISFAVVACDDKDHRPVNKPDTAKGDANQW